MIDTVETRRRFMTHFASVGLGTTLVPGVLWARMQDAGASQITLAMLTDALKLSGVELSEDDLHPNARGYAIMAPLAEAAIMQALR